MNAPINPVMQLAMEKALQQANVPAPAIAERVFNLIKDEPGITTLGVMSRLSALNQTTVRTQVTRLKERGLVVSRGSARPLGHSGRGIPSKRLYLADPNCSYEQQMKATRGGAALPKPAMQEKVAVLRSAPPAPPAPSSESFDEQLNRLIDNMTVGQARELFNRLRRMFA